MSALEAALGVQLVARTPEGVLLNDAGQLAAELAETIDGGIEDLMRRIDRRIDGDVSDGGPRNPAPSAPQDPVQLAVSNAALDLARREADMTVRLSREKSPTLITRKIGEIGWSVFAKEWLTQAERDDRIRGRVADQLTRDIAAYDGSPVAAKEILRGLAAARTMAIDAA